MKESLHAAAAYNLEMCLAPVSATAILFVGLFGIGLIVIVTVILKLHRRIKPDPDWRNNLDTFSGP